MVYQWYEVRYGEEIPVPTTPTKEGHTFNRWLNPPKTMPAKDVTIFGIFDINKYLVTFKIGDDIIASDSLTYGTAIVAPEAPEKEGYTFNGWQDVPETVPASDVTIESSYTINTYIANYVVDDEVYQTFEVTYGEQIPEITPPTKTGHTFTGWSEIPGTMPAHDVTITAIFSVNQYLVTFKIGDEVIASDSLEYGATINIPDTPEKEGHTFCGWGEVAGTVPANDLVYEGSYSVNIYNVYYYVGDKLIHTDEVAYGEVIPEYTYDPAEEDAEFLGWIGEFYETMPAHDIAYIANIDTAIDLLKAKESDATIYDLKGRKVNTALIKRGIYIVNGKKVLMK
jgi:hypothetical protein